MLHSRRNFLLGAAAMPLLGVGSACLAQSGAVFQPEDFGAAGNGRTDDTAAIQRCIDAAPEGATIRLRQGAVYRVDTNARPSLHEYGGVRLKSRQILNLNGGELKALPTRAGEGAVVQSYGVHGWRIIGPGRITGESDIHIGRGGEWGMGVLVWNASGWTIGPDVEISNCWGDGIYVGNAIGQPGRYCDDFSIVDVHVHDCRRNGITLIAARRGTIRGASIHNIVGTPPQAGIDLEPDDARHPNRNITISDVRISGVQVGVGISIGNEDVRIQGSDIQAENSGVLIGDNSRRVTIASNSRIASTRGGAEGGAIRNVAANGASIADITISGNALSGGGFFVLDFANTGYRNLRIAGNRISATNRGTLGFARLLSGGLFTDNECTIGGAAGRPDETFIQFRDVIWGRNRYSNQSRSRMVALIGGGQELAPDSYLSATLTQRRN